MVYECVDIHIIAQVASDDAGIYIGTWSRGCSNPNCWGLLVRAVHLSDIHKELISLYRGGGAAEMFDVVDQVDIHIGTLSKGFGSHGGFVAGSRVLKSFLMNRGRSYVFSTALPLPAVAAAQAAMTVCAQVCHHSCTCKAHSICGDKTGDCLLMASLQAQVLLSKS